MKKKFLQNKKLKKRKLAWLVVFFAVFLVLAAYVRAVNYNVSGFFTALAKPFFAAGESFKEYAGKGVFMLKSKSVLRSENSELKEKNAELEAKFAACELLKKENDELKTFLSRNPGKDFALAAIISKPPRSPYDILVVDAGAENGLKEGMAVKVYDNILLGYLADVFGNTGKIKMVSCPGEELSVVIAPAGGEAYISAVAVGKGGGNMEIKLPNSIQVNSGDQIMTTGAFPSLVGFVERVELDLSDPLQKIMFRLPVNLQELQSVMIEIN